MKLYRKKNGFFELCGYDWFRSTPAKITVHSFEWAVIFCLREGLERRLGSE